MLLPRQGYHLSLAFNPSEARPKPLYKPQERRSGVARAPLWAAQEAVFHTSR